MKFKIKDHLKSNLKSIKKISPAVCCALVCVAQSPSAVATSDGATILANEVTNAKIQAGAVDNRTMAIDAVATDNIQAGAVNEDKIADLNVSTAKI